MQTSVYLSLHSKLDRVFLSYDVKAIRLLAISGTIPCSSEEISPIFVEICS